MAKLKVLIIDDEIDYCTIMRNYFITRDYEVSISFLLNQGLELINTLQPDILFLDNNLPDGKGWTHVESIVEKNPHLRIYLVSAYHRIGEFPSPSPNVIVWEKPLSRQLLNDNF
jgi:two-component system OmpR family response regulator